MALAVTVYSINQARSLQSEAKGKPTQTLATLSVTPDPVPARTNPTVSGTGFTSGKELLVGIPGDLRFTRMTPDSTGSFSFVDTARQLVPATYTIEAWGQRGKNWELKASTLFV